MKNHRRRSKLPMVAACLTVTSFILVMSGACSQHQPGPYEGGGRSFEVPSLQGSVVGPDAGPDINIPDSFNPDNFVFDAPKE